jgi:hypothetical protein
MQVLPGDALRAFLDLHPAPLATAGHAVRRLVRGYDDACAALTDPGVWTGPAASAYDEARAALLRHLDEGPESLVGRIESTAGYADALAHWVEGSRLAVARVLAEVLGSTEAVRVLAATAPGGETLLHQWSPSLTESTWRASTGGPVRYDSTTRVGR